MKLSIITPSFNQAQYLPLTIRSVLGSTRKPDEYFVIDGASSDGSVDIIRGFESQLTKWISENDSGQAEAINKGFALATGDIIGWLNSDDLILPDAFEKVMATFEQNPDAAMVYGDANAIDQDGRLINIQRFALYSLEDLMQFRIICQPAVFFRRSALLQAGPMDMSYHYLLDHQLWLRIAQHGNLIYLPTTLAAARYHSQAKNLLHTSKFGQEAFRIIDWMRTDEMLAHRFLRHKKAIWAGAYRLDGYYQLEGRQFWAGLRSYGKAIISQPVTLVIEGKHILYGILGLMQLDQIKDWYKQWRKNRYEKSND